MEVSEILEQVDILEYIQQFCDLEKKNGEWWGLSPFKEEKTPSFSVNTEKQKFYDFSSGIGGNLIDFIVKYDGCSFIEALNTLKKYANIIDNGGQCTGRLECSKIARKFKRKHNDVKESKCQVLSDDYMERYDFNTEKLAAWVKEGIGLKTMRKFGVRYDQFSNRIVYPIKNYSGDIINVCGRTIDVDFKEKGLRKYTYFKPLGILDTLYGFSDNQKDILSSREIILFEGAKSVMIAHEWGIYNTAAILTSHLNPQQLLFLIKLGIRVVFALDEDVDISEDVNIAKLKRYVKIEAVKNFDNLLSEKMAPVDAGREVWKELYERRVSVN